MMNIFSFNIQYTQNILIFQGGTWWFEWPKFIFSYEEVPVIFLFFHYTVFFTSPGKVHLGVQWMENPFTQMRFVSCDVKPAARVILTVYYNARNYI